MDRVWKSYEETRSLGSSWTLSWLHELAHSVHFLSLYWAMKMFPKTSGRDLWKCNWRKGLKSVYFRENPFTYGLLNLGTMILFYGKWTPWSLTKSSVLALMGILTQRGIFTDSQRIPHLRKKLRTNTYNPNPTKFYHSQQIQLLSLNCTVMETSWLWGSQW